MNSSDIHDTHPKISVIVPVYNAAAHLHVSIGSLIGQTETDLEFIIINDGSSDESRNIILEFAALDSRISLHDQPNKGVSAARNAGIEKARGKYLAFVDADDCVEPDYFYTLLKNAEAGACDVVVSGIVKEQDGHLVKSKKHFPTGEVLSAEFSRSRIVPLMICKDDLNSSCCKLYHRRFFDQAGVRFPEGVALGEDGIFNMNIFYNAGRIMFLDYFGYRYREVAGSASRNVVSKDYFARALEVFHLDYNQYFPFDFDREELPRLKSIRLIGKVASYSMLYLGSGTKGSYDYVRKMIRHPQVQKSIREVLPEVRRGKSRFEEFILYCIRRRWAFGLMIASRYSQHRNKR